MIEDRFFAIIELCYLLVVRRDERNVLADIFIIPLVIDIDIGEGIIEEISEHSNSFVCLCEKEVDTF